MDHYFAEIEVLVGFFVAFLISLENANQVIFILIWPILGISLLLIGTLILTYMTIETILILILN